MKKRLSFVLAIAFLFAGLSACNKPENDPSVSETRAGWTLSAPAYMDGELALNLYSTGVGLDLNPDNKAGDMQLITKTSRAKFETYLSKVQKNGYQEIAKNEVNGNLYAEFEKDNEILYTYYTDAFGEARVIEDKVSVAHTDIEYEHTQKDGKDTVIYQYALMNDPYGNNNKSTPYADNGMFYIIRQANDKLILVDGGSAKQAPESAVDGLLQFLYQITGKPQSEKIEVSAFILTHGHSDHKQLVQKLIQKYSDKIDIESAIYNIPWLTQKSAFMTFGALIKEKYPNIKYLKPHTGQSIRLGEVTLDILLTHEDIVDEASGFTKISNYNNTTTVMKYTVNGKTFMQLGDFSGSQNNGKEKIFLGMYKDADGAYPVLQSDIVQVAHHALENDMENTYQAIGARYAFIPQADCNFSEYRFQQAKCSTYQDTVNDIISANANVEMFFQNRNTYALSIAKNGAITKLAPIAIIGADEGYAELIGAVSPFHR